MKRTLLLLFTVCACGRAMTLAFISQAGGTNPGDPPAAWLMPLVGDAVIGISGLFIVFLLVTKRTGLFAWSAIVVWNSIAIWDALSAYIVHTTNPWPEFFMIQMLGSAMFFGASAMHLINIYIVSQPELRKQFSV